MHGFSDAAQVILQILSNPAWSGISGSISFAKGTYDFLSFVLGIAGSGIIVMTSPDYLLDGLTAGYVLLTLAIAIIAFRSLSKTQASLDLTRQQIELNKQQSQEASAASERHSKATIDTVNKQIAASEKQAQAALIVAREQIEQSKQPILIPLSTLPLTAVAPQLDYTHSQLPLELMNVGTGVALNIWGVLVPPQNVPQTPYSLRNQAHLLQSKVDKVVLHKKQSYFFTEKDIIGELDLRPSSELTQVGTIDVLRYAARLTLTYIDVFGNKHATIYDYTTANEWKIVAHFRVQRDLEDMYKEKNFQ